MKRSTRRWGQTRLHYQVTDNIAKLDHDFYQEHPFWQMVVGLLEAEDKASAANDNHPALAVDGGK